MQRYTFKAVTFEDSNDSTAVEICEKPKPKPFNLDFKSTITLTPQNMSSITANMFVAALEITDLRYSLGCYGDFLRYIPKRLGQCDALDASVKALVSAFPYHYTRQVPADVLADYISALKELRLCLNGTGNKMTAERLCAIYFIMICQVRSYLNSGLEMTF